MAIFRRIIAKDREFLWHYGFDSDDYQCDSQIVIKDCGRKGKMVIRFRSGCSEYGYCPFNKGLRAVKDGEETIINLNRPKHIAEILIHILDSRLRDDGLDTSVEYRDGIEILAELGYSFNYHLVWNV